MGSGIVTTRRTGDQSRFGMPAGPSGGNSMRAAILSSLADVRAGHRPGPTRLDWGALMLRIPELDYAVLLRRFPDLSAPDHEIKRRAWVEFAATPQADPYRVTPRNLARHPGGTP